MIYLLLVIIIILLLVIIYQRRDKGAYFNNLFKPLNVEEFKEDDRRNKTHPNEYVKMGFRYMKRSEAVNKVVRLREVYKGLSEEDFKKIRDISF